MGKRDTGKTAPVWKRSADDSSGLFAGMIFLSVIVILVGLIMAGIILLAGPMLSSQGNNPGLPAPSVTPEAITATPQATIVTAPVTIAPTVIVQPDVPPDMMVHAKLRRSDNIVGLWKSTDILQYGRPWSKSDNFNLTIYNDNTYIVYDKARQTYTIGQWARVSEYNYSLTEPGRNGPSRILGDFYHLQFQYNDHGTGQSPDRELVDYDRIYYPGFYNDMYGL